MEAARKKSASATCAHTGGARDDGHTVLKGSSPIWTAATGILNPIQSARNSPAMSTLNPVKVAKAAVSKQAPVMYL